MVEFGVAGAEHGNGRYTPAVEHVHGAAVVGKGQSAASGSCHEFAHGELSCCHNVPFRFHGAYCLFNEGNFRGHAKENGNQPFFRKMVSHLSVFFCRPVLFCRGASHGKTGQPVTRLNALGFIKCPGFLSHSGDVKVRMPL